MARIHRRNVQKRSNDPDNHDAVITHLESAILECEVKWALGSITMNKASGGDGIPVELFQILKDDALKVLYSICQQIWKTQQWPQDWKRSVFISGLPFPSPGDLPDPGIKLRSPILQADALPSEPPGTPFQNKGNTKECSNYHTVALISHACKVMLKILQARLQQYVIRELPDV